MLVESSQDFMLPLLPPSLNLLIQMVVGVCRLFVDDDLAQDLHEYLVDFLLID